MAALLLSLEAGAAPGACRRVLASFGGSPTERGQDSTAAPG